MTNSPHLPRHPIGFPLLTRPDETGTWAWPGLGQSVRDSLRAILMTRPGEWLLHRQRGVGLVDYLQRPNTAETRKALRDRIQQEVGLLEKRIALDAVEVVATGARGDEITITLRYRILRTGAADSQTVTLTLAGAA